MDYLLDTNIVLGLLRENDSVISWAQQKTIFSE